MIRSVWIERAAMLTGLKPYHINREDFGVHNRKSLSNRKSHSCTNASHSNPSERRMHITNVHHVLTMQQTRGTTHHGK